ncbi:hypothetical protein ZWY2020_000870 [Hordeum vulgare]|nr:hypothetical protein ZWY2020_000870 [Hordeum vulgare]
MAAEKKTAKEAAQWDRCIAVHPQEEEEVTLAGLRIKTTSFIASTPYIISGTPPTSAALPTYRLSSRPRRRRVSELVGRQRREGFKFVLWPRIFEVMLVKN